MQKQLITVGIEDLIPYENNPRNNEEAIEAVCESIRQCEYIAPIIVDEDYTILAGHTRYEALRRLGKAEVEVMVVSGLTEEQKKKYRLLDNKTNEFASWDFEKLAEELTDIDFDGYDFGFGIEGDGDIDDIFTDAPEKQKEKGSEMIQCPHCGEWFAAKE